MVETPHAYPELTVYEALEIACRIGIIYKGYLLQELNMDPLS